MHRAVIALLPTSRTRTPSRRKLLPSADVTRACLPGLLGRGVRLWEGLQNRNDLEFDPPVVHGGRMVQVSARVVRR